MTRSKGHIPDTAAGRRAHRPGPRPGAERPGHPTAQAAILLVVVTLLIVGLAVVSSVGHP